MSSILDQIKPDTAETNPAEAQARGLSVDEYLRSLLPKTNGDDGEKPLYETTTPAELAQAYVDWAQSHDKNRPVILNDSREIIYEDAI